MPSHNDVIFSCPVCKNPYMPTPENVVCPNCQMADKDKELLANGLKLMKLEFDLLKLRVELLEAKMSQVLPGSTPVKVEAIQEAIERSRG